MSNWQAFCLTALVVLHFAYLREICCELKEINKKLK